MEALASKTAIERRVRKAINKGMATLLAERLIDEEDDSKAASSPSVAASDPIALKEIHRSAHYSGLAGESDERSLTRDRHRRGGVAGALGEPYVELVRSSARKAGSR